MSNLNSGDPSHFLEPLNDADHGAIDPGGQLSQGDASLDVKVLADSIPQLVWIAHADGWIYWYNRRWYEYTGTTPEQMAGWGWQSVHDPAVLPQVMERWQRSIHTGESFEMEFPLRSVDGGFRWFLTRVAPLRNLSGKITRWYGTNTDITEIKDVVSLLRESEEKLRQSEDRLRISLDAAQMGIWDWNLLTGEIIWSDRCRQLFAMEPHDKVTHEEFLRAIHPDDRHLIDRTMRDALEQRKDYSAVMRTLFPDGTVRWVLSNGRALYDEAGRQVRMMGVAQDITQRHLVEERIRQTQKLESLGILAGGIAHDFNNLLTGIMAGASLALDEIGEDSSIGPLLHAVLNSGDRAADLTRQMLAYSGKGQFLLHHVNLSKKVLKTIPLIEHFISKKIRLELNLSENLPLIEADRSQIDQVIMNLLTNAGEAIGDQAGTIAIGTGVEHIDELSPRSESLRAEGLQAGSYVTLTIRDTGCGMDQAQQSRIFDPFFTTKATGRGLGLAAIHGIVRGHKGTIEVASKPGKGTLFRVLFPASAMGSEQVDLTQPVFPPKTTEDATILVVDDEELVRHVARAVLESRGHRVFVAKSGGEAIDLLKRHFDQISLVLLDLSMPGLSGSELLPLLRTIQPNLRIVISSGFSEADVVRQFENEQISGVLHKPYLAAALINAVGAALSTVSPDAR
jgi:two-component system cell cycle sensor histidine kinase/response regulator CckA